MNLPKMNFPDILRYIGYIFFGIFIFIFFTYLNFPYEKLKDTLFSKIEKHSGFIIDAEDIKTTLTFGMQLTDIRIGHRTLDFRPLQFENLKISPSLLSLATFRPKVKFEAAFKEGVLNGYFQTKSNRTHAILLNLDNVLLKSRELKEDLPLDISGILNGDFQIQGNFQKPSTLEGTSHLRILKFAFGKITVLNMGFPEIKLSKISLNGRIKNEKFIVERLDVGGEREDLMAMATGNIELDSRNITNSRLDLNLRFKLSQRLKDEFSLFLPFIASAQGKDGFYSLKIRGSLSSPIANPQS